MTFNKNNQNIPKGCHMLNPGLPVLLLWHFIWKDVCVVANCSSLVLTAVLSHHKTLNLCNWSIPLLSGNGGELSFVYCFLKYIKNKKRNYCYYKINLAFFSFAKIFIGPHMALAWHCQICINFNSFFVCSKIFIWKSWLEILFSIERFLLLGHTLMCFHNCQHQGLILISWTLM